MQTTLRIDDELYRQAKARAAEEGVTLTQFLEEGLALRLAQPREKADRALPSFRAGDDVGDEFDLVAAIKEREDSSDRALGARFRPQPKRS